MSERGKDRGQPTCIECRETVDGMTWWKFENGQEGWLCPNCEDELVDQHGTVMIE